MRALALVLAGCGGPADTGAAGGCPDVDGWYLTDPGTVRRHGATIDFDPPGAPLVRRVGTWDPATGALAWTDTYAEGYPLVRGETTGSLLCDESGDCAGTTETTTTDVLGETRTFVTDWAEAGCRRDRAVTPPADSGYAPYTARVEVVDADTVTASWDTTYEGRPYHREETATRDLDVAYSLVYDGDLYERHGVYHGDGTSEHAYVVDTGARRTLGAWRGFFDGGRRLDFAAFDAASGAPVEWGSGRYTYAGAVRGLWMFREAADDPWVRCDWASDGAGTCTLSCDDGSVIDCAP